MIQVFTLAIRTSRLRKIAILEILVLGLPQYKHQHFPSNADIYAYESYYYLCNTFIEGLGEPNFGAMLLLDILLMNSILFGNTYIIAEEI